MSGGERSESGGMTANELLRRLEADPAWVLERDRREAALADVSETRRRDEAPVVAALSAVGLEVASLWMLDSSVAGREDVLAVLLDHMSRPTYSDFTREAIARSIGRTGIQSAWPELARRYCGAPGPREAQGLAVALVECAGAGRLEDLLAMLRDPTLGSSRLLMIRSVTRRLRGRGDDVLRELALDDQLSDEAAAVLHEREVARAGRAQRAERPAT